MTPELIKHLRALCDAVPLLEAEDRTDFNEHGWPEFWLNTAGETWESHASIRAGCEEALEKCQPAALSEFITAARQHLPRALDEIERLTAEVASLRASLGQQPAGDGAEPIGCPCPGACSASAAVAKMRDAVSLFRSFGCPLCSGDCGSANPPVYVCPMQVAEEALKGHRP